MQEVSGNIFKRPSARSEKDGTGTGGTEDALGTYDEALKCASSWKQLKLAHESIAKQKVWPRIRKTRLSRSTAKGHLCSLDDRPCRGSQNVTHVTRIDRLQMAERVRFELTNGFPLPVFKTLNSLHAPNRHATHVADR
jgi:hypothetical protein